MTNRKAEAPGVRRWDGDVAAANALDRTREWVVWGTGGAPPPDLREGLTDDPVVQGFAREADGDWDALPEAERWVAVARGEENEIEAMVEDAEEVRGYVPYLIPGRPEEMPQGYMRDQLRDDVAPRRKVDQPRPT